MSDLEELRLAERQVIKAIDETAGYISRSRSKIKHEQADIEYRSRKMEEGRARLIAIREKIASLQPLCLFEDEAAEKCAMKASWKIEFPKIATMTADSESWRVTSARGASSPTTTTFACHDHLYMMADDYSGGPALVTPIKEGQ